MFEVGGPEVLEYLEMLTRVAEIQGRHMFVLPVPLLSPQLSSRWLALVTDVDLQTGRSLIDSMTNEVVVRDDSIRQVVPSNPWTTTRQCSRRWASGRRRAAEQGGRVKHGGLLARGARS